MTWRPLPGDEPDEPRPVADSIDRLGRSLGAPASGLLTALFGRWPELVGDQVAAHARPVSLVSGVLVLAVDDPAWRTQLVYLERDLLARLEAALGADAVSRIEVRVQPSRGR